MKLSLIILPLFLLSTGILLAQPTIPKKVAKGDLECEILLDIYDGFFDWTTGTPWSGNGMPKSSLTKVVPGAVCVANLNDTNGNNVVDLTEFPIPNTPANRKEIDLIKIAVRKKNPGSTLGGTVTLTKKNGNIKLWKEPTKQTFIDTSSPIEISAASLPAIFFIEATQASGAVGDIWFQATYNGNMDEVKATAVWVTEEGDWFNATNAPVPGTAPLTNVGGLVTYAVNQNIAENGTRYGHGDCRINPISYNGWSDNSTNDKEYGGRILMEWKIAPPDAAQVASFDVTRQRKTSTWFVDYGDYAFEASAENMEFPTQDNETPNDDAADGDEDRDPINNFLYSWDNPAVYKKYTGEEYRAFHVSKNAFKEFVRVRPKSSSFTNNDATLQGSRASAKYDWHCVFYARRDNGYELGIDAALASHTQLKSNQIEVNNYYMVTVNGINVAYEVGTFSIVYYGIDPMTNMKELMIGRFDGMTNVSQTLTLPPSQSTWTINFEGVQMTLKELQTVPDLTFVNFNTFKTNAGVKDNIIKDGDYTNFVR